MSEVASASTTRHLCSQSGSPVPTCSYVQWRGVMCDLSRRESISQVQVAEGCGFSFAMVVRFALGLSAQDGVVTLFVSDTFFGWVALACARHLINAGCAVRIILVGMAGMSSFESGTLLPSLEQRGSSVHAWTDASAMHPVRILVESSHNVLCGVSDASADQIPWLRQLSPLLNESAVPVHTVGAPIGTPLDGPPTIEPLYASSTLSIGLPLDGILENIDLVGRHYLADASWSRETYFRLGYDGPPLFAEQPVIRLVSPFAQ